MSEDDQRRLEILTELDKKQRVMIAALERQLEIVEGFNRELRDLNRRLAEQNLECDRQFKNMLVHVETSQQLLNDADQSMTVLANENDALRKELARYKGTHPGN